MILRPVLGDVLLDLGTGLGVDDDDNVVEARGVGVRGDEVNDAFAVQDRPGPTA